MKLRNLIKYWVALLAEYCIVKNSDVVVVVSEHDTEYLSKRYPHLAQKFFQVPVYTSENKSSEYTFCETDPKVVIFADNSVDYLFHSVDHFLETHANSRYKNRFIILGKNSDVLSNKHNVMNINFIDDIDAFLTNNKVVILPDLVGSGVKTRFVHCLKLGVPVAATPAASEGIPSLLNEKNFIAINVDNHTCDLDAALSRLIDERYYISINAKALADNFFTNSSINNRWQEIVQSCV